MPTTIIRRLALTGATGGVIALTGCAAVSTTGGLDASQATPLSPISAAQSFCTADDDYSYLPYLREAARRDEAPTCAPFGGFYLTRFTEAGAGRLLLAVAIPDGVADPTPALRKHADATFTPEPAAVAGLSAAPEGYHWVGYRSSTVSYAVDEPDAGDDVVVRFAARRDGSRLSTSATTARIAVGVQVSKDGSGGSYAADRPVDCDEQLEDSTPGADRNVDSTTCPTDGRVRTSTIDATDALIEAPEATVEVQAGSKVAVPFVVQQVGTAPSAAEMALAARSDADGATATPAVGSLPWTVPTVEEPPVTTTEETPPTETIVTTTDEVPPTDTIVTTTDEVPPTDTTVTTTDEVPPTDTTVTTTEEVPPTETVVTTTEGTPPTDTVVTRDPLARADDASDAGRPVVETAVPVEVAVPSGTAPGLYSVTLTGSDAGGERAATARIRVTAAPTPTPAAPAPTAPAPATPAAPRKPISVTVKLLRSTTVSRRTRRLHLGRVTCVRDTSGCVVRTKVRVGKRTIGSVTAKVKPNASAGVTLRLSKANMERLIARSAVATTTITAAGSDPVVRTTTVAAKRAAKRP